MRRRLSGPEIRLMLAILVVSVFFLGHGERQGEGCFNEVFRFGSGQSAIILQNNTSCNCQFLCINTKNPQESRSMTIPPNKQGTLSVYFGTYNIKGIIIDKNGKPHGVLSTTAKMDETSDLKFWIDTSDPGVPDDCK